MAPIKPFQLLEINIIAAQDLEPVSRKMKTYVTAWVHPNRKLTSRVDSDGHNNPTWNDKFVFRVEEEFLQLDTAAVMLEIYSRSWFKDTLVGTVRVLVGNLFPPHTRPQPNQRNLHLGMRFVALQVRRQSGRPQGILNIGVALLDGSMRSMPLYNTIAASAVGYHDLMGEDDPKNQHENNNRTITQPILRRSISERSGMKFDNMSMAGSSMVGVPHRKFDSMSMAGSSMVGVPHRKFDNMSMAGSSMVGVPKFDMSMAGSSMVGVPKFDMSTAGSSMIGVPKFAMSTTGSSMVGVPHRKFDNMSMAGSSMVAVPQKKVPGKASSVVSGSEFGEPIKIKGVKGKASSVINGTELKDPKTKEKRGKASSLVSSHKDERKTGGSTSINKVFIKKNAAGSEVNGSEVGGKPTKSALGLPPRSSVSGAGRYLFAPPPKPYSTWSDSEVGPSPSEVAAAMMERKYPLEDEWSSVLDGWSLDESVEGLRSKLERWRTELPPLYDRRGSSSFRSSTTQQTQKQTADNNAGLFSCFGNFAGYECQCVCGKPRQRKRSGLHSPSVSGSSKGGSTFV